MDLRKAEPWAFREVGKVEEGLIYDGGLMGDGSGTGERPCWVECQRS